MAGGIPVIGVAGNFGKLIPFSTIGGKGNESFIGCCLIDLGGGFLLDVPEERGQQVMAGRLCSVPHRDARFWSPIFVGACQ